MTERFGQPDSAFTVLMASGFLAIPGILLRVYKKLGLADEEMMLLFHLMQFRQEGVSWPTCRELGERMSTKEEIVEEMISTLMRQGYLGLSEVNGEQGLDLSPLYRKLNAWLEPKPTPQPASLDLLEKKDAGGSIFVLFEQEFGRPLSPLEYEKIVRWLDEDRYREELIREALREAVMAAKFNFKYIDRILFEWQKNHIRSLQDLQAYREQFRNRVQSRGGAGQGGGHAARKPREPQQQPPADAGKLSNGDKYDVFYKMYRE